MNYLQVVKSNDKIFKNTNNNKYTQGNIVQPIVQPLVQPYMNQKKEKNNDLNLTFLTQTNDYYIQRKKICCKNCGKLGHIFRNCKEPITSLGVIAFSIDGIDIENIEKQLITNLTYIETSNKYNNKYFGNEKDIFNRYDKLITPSNNNIKKFKRKIEDHCIIYKNSEVLDKFNFYQDKIKFILVSRKYSLGYIEFLRGKYNINDVDNIIDLFEQMIQSEFKLLENNDIKDLIVDFRISNGLTYEQANNAENILIEYEESIKKFRQLKDMKLDVTNGNFNLKFYLDNVKPKWVTPEWGFPKGRRNFSEKNVECAKREFCEETSLNNEQYNLLNVIRPLHEVFYGTNGVKYKHTYYVGYTNIKNTININKSLQKNNNYIDGEIGEIGIYTYNEAMQLIRPYHIEKKKILTQIYIFILNYLINEIETN
jgi:8-oxo-dGTP pyrophosphatase MutT (NUDIX family)